MTTATELDHRFGELVRRDEWEEAERWSVDEAFEFADDMLDLNVYLYGDRIMFYWWECFDYSLLADYPEWKWEEKPQFGLEEFAGKEGSA